jgi:ribosomal protein L10
MCYKKTSMATSRSKKIGIFNRIQQKVASQATVVFLTTTGTDNTVDAAANFALRMGSMLKGVKIEVVKNSLLNKAFPALPVLAGQTYIAYLADDSVTDDKITVAKITVPSVSKKGDFFTNFKVIGAVSDGIFLDEKATDSLSKTLSLPESMAKIAGSINQIIAKIAIGVKEVADDKGTVLNLKSE